MENEKMLRKINRMGLVPRHIFSNTLFLSLINSYSKEPCNTIFGLKGSGMIIDAFLTTNTPLPDS